MKRIITTIALAAVALTGTAATASAAAQHRVCQSHETHVLNIQTWRGESVLPTCGQAHVVIAAQRTTNGVSARIHPGGHRWDCRVYAPVLVGYEYRYDTRCWRYTNGIAGRGWPLVEWVTTDGGD